MTIAIDVMGGDFAPKIPVVAAINYTQQEKRKVILVGDKPAIQRELDQLTFDPTKVDIAHAEQQILMTESVLDAMRGKRKSSMRIAYDLHKTGEAQAVVSAGHSGAMLALGKFVLKTIQGIERPCIGAILPSNQGHVLLADAGANLGCTAEQLLQFAILCDVYINALFKTEHPRIGLLNIGKESNKGDEVLQHAYQLLEASSLNFKGNIEGKEFFDHEVDAVVADGFAGNILLKSVQGAAKFIKTMLKNEINSSWAARGGALLMSGAFNRLRKRIDYEAYNGALLLGLKGVSVVCHGSSNVLAMNHAYNFAHKTAEAGIGPRVEEKVLANFELLKSTKIAKLAK